MVVRAINAHKVVAILFFNKAATDDQAVKAELATIPTYKGHVVKLAVPVSELVQYPVITTQVPITGSPTLVLIDPSAHVTTIVGFSDRFEIGRRVAADLGHAGSCSVASYSAGCVRHYSAAEKAYLAKVRKVCANFSPAPIKTGPMTRAAAMAYYSGVLAIIGKLQTSVGAIPGPDPLHAQMAGALATERQTVRLIDSAMAAMKNGDVARARSLVAQAKAVEAPADAVFRGVGLGICVGG